MRNPLESWGGSNLRGNHTDCLLACVQLFQYTSNSSNCSPAAVVPSPPLSDTAGKLTDHQATTGLVVQQTVVYQAQHNWTWV
jgi:hypothetical protein